MCSLVEKRPSEVSEPFALLSQPVPLTSFVFATLFHSELPRLDYLQNFYETRVHCSVASAQSANNQRCEERPEQFS
jgi:hypothetical protein